MAVKRKPKQDAPVLTIDEVTELYRDQWVLLKVTERDERHEPLAGQVVAVSKTERGVCNKMAKLDAEAGGWAPGSYYIFNAFPLIRVNSLEELRAALDAADENWLPHGWKW